MNSKFAKKEFLANFLPVIKSSRTKHDLNLDYDPFGDDVPLYLCTSDEGTFQIVLHETTNIIDNYLTEIPSCVRRGGGYSVQGIEKEDGYVAFTAPDRNYEVWETEVKVTDGCQMQ